MRVVVPPLVAALVTAFAALLLGLFDPLLGVVLVLFLVLTGVVLPLCSRWIGRQPSRDLVAVRAELNAVLVDQVQGIADLVAFDQAERHRRQALDAGRRSSTGSGSAWRSSAAWAPGSARCWPASRASPCWASPSRW